MHADQIEQIRRGLAANLSAVSEHVSPYLQEAPMYPVLSVVGFESADYNRSFGRTVRSVSLVALVEGAAGAASSEGAQRIFDSWLLAVPEALMENQKLTRRWIDGGTVVDAAAAADALSVLDFRGYVRVLIKAQEVLTGLWPVQLLVSLPA